MFLELELPWMLALLPVPYLVWRFAPPFEERVEALRVPYFARLTALTGAEPRRGAVVRRRGLVRWVLLVTIWVATVLALTRPVVKGEPVTVTRSARDLLLAVDLSGSMDTRDLADSSGEPATRLAVVKEVVGDFVARREGDRLGLVVFGAAPYVQVPFTLDTGLVTQLLGETDTGMAGDSTALGDAVGLAIRIFDTSEASNRVLVLLTDGNDTGSSVPPLTAARIAGERGITIHVVGVGDPRTAGEERLNEDVLAKIARRTSGRYFRANDRDALARTYAELDRIEPVAFESRSYTPTRSAFHLPLGVAAVLVVAFSLALSLPAFRARGRRPARGGGG